MTPEERTRFAIAITGIAETLGQQMTPARISGLLVALDDLPWIHLERALTIAHRTARFVPSPGELRELAEEAARTPRDYKALPPIERTYVATTWAGKGEEVRQLIAALPKPPQWPEDGPDFKGYTEAVARRMHDMHDMHASAPTVAQKGTPDGAGADKDSQRRQG